MAHKSFEELAELLHWATTYVTVGGYYRHYKDPMAYYLVTGFCVLEESDEIAVRYTSSKNRKVEFVRPISSWLDILEIEGEEIPRFAKLS